MSVFLKKPQKDTQQADPIPLLLDHALFPN